jgi:hypothetical protein
MNNGGSKPTIQINIAGMSETISIQSSDDHSDADDAEWSNG